MPTRFRNLVEFPKAKPANQLLLLQGLSLHLHEHDCDVLNPGTSNAAGSPGTHGHLLYLQEAADLVWQDTKLGLRFAGGFLQRPLLDVFSSPVLALANCSDSTWSPESAVEDPKSSSAESAAGMLKLTISSLVMRAAIDVQTT